MCYSKIAKKTKKYTKAEKLENAADTLDDVLMYLASLVRIAKYVRGRVLEAVKDISN